MPGALLGGSLWPRIPIFGMDAIRDVLRGRRLQPTAEQETPVGSIDRHEQRLNDDVRVISHLDQDPVEVFRMFEELDFGVCRERMVVTEPVNDVRPNEIKTESGSIDQGPRLA